MTFADWLAEGRAAGFVVGVFCANHDAAPLTATEKDSCRRNDLDPLDVCAPSVRVVVQ